MALTAEQELILDCLCERTTETSAEIARYACLSKLDTISILEHLCDQGYVVREKVHKKWLYRITEAGRKAATAYNPAVWSA